MMAIIAVHAMMAILRLLQILGVLHAISAFEVTLDCSVKNPLKLMAPVTNFLLLEGPTDIKVYHLSGLPVHLDLFPPYITLTKLHTFK